MICHPAIFDSVLRPDLYADTDISVQAQYWNWILLSNMPVRVNQICQSITDAVMRQYWHVLVWGWNAYEYNKDIQ